MNDMYRRLIDILEDEISKIVKDGEVTQASLCNLDTLIDVVKDIHEITAMEDREYGYSGYRGMVYNDGYSGHDSYRYNDFDNRSRYDDIKNDNRYMKYEGDMRYSGNGEKDHMISLMEEAMELATSKEDKDEIMKMIHKMKK